MKVKVLVAQLGLTLWKSRGVYPAGSSVTNSLGRISGLVPFSSPGGSFQQGMEPGLLHYRQDSLLSEPPVYAFVCVDVHI